MNFEKFFESARNKLVMIDEFIERERRVLEDSYQKLPKDTDSEESILDAKVGSLIKYVETLKGEIDSNYQKILILMKEKGFSLEDLEVSQNRLNRFDKMGDLSGHSTNPGTVLNQQQSPQHYTRRPDLELNNHPSDPNSMTLKDDLQNAHNILSSGNPQRVTLDAPIAQRALDNIREERMRIQAMRRDLEEEYQAIQIEESNLQAKK